VCGPMDHIYPLPYVSPVSGTPCYCGKRTWGKK
jgi:hypothetical protein